jgi:DNA polymerase III gamma/tau subunit
MVVDHRNKTPEMMEVLQNEWKAYGQSKIAPFHRSIEINRLKRKLEVLTKESDDTTEQKKDLEMEINRLESETLEERNQRKEEEARKQKEESRKRKEENDNRKKEDARKRKEEEDDRKKEDARTRKEQEKEQIEQAWQQKKEQEEHALQQKEEQEEQAPKTRGKYKTFDDRMEDLKLFKEKYGHVNLSVSSVSFPEDKSLAKFCVKMRHAHNNPGKSKSKQLTNEQIAAFDALDFDWTTRECVTRSFDERIDDLEKYKRTHGHISVKIHEDSSLYDFIASVRYSLKHADKDGRRKLTVERRARLDALGFEWTNQNQR